MNQNDQTVRPESGATRRQFLEMAGVAGGLCTFAPSVAPSVRAAPSPASEVITRPNIRTLKPDGPEIAALRRGVATMKSRKSSDPTSWAYQAAVHGVFASYYYWNQCKHGNWWFLPWHRMYLYYFERILRAAAEEPGLALPYWSWDDLGDPSQRALPVAFRVPDSENANPLYDLRRSPALNRPNRPGLLSDYNVSGILQLSNFENTNLEGFGGRPMGHLGSPQAGHGSVPHWGLERYPHDPIHTQVGGRLVLNGQLINGNMALPETAALDPVFWLHHANIDRLWKVWRRDPRHSDPSDETWLDQTFTFFKEDGKPEDRAVRDVLDTVRGLGYRYDDDPQDEDEPAPRPRGRRRPAQEEAEAMPDHQDEERALGNVLASAEAGKAVLGNRPSSVTIPLPPEAHAAIQGAAEDRRPTPMVLTLEDIRFEVDPGAPYGVYLNLPDTGRRPCPDDIHFAGTVAFFGLHAHPAPANNKNAPVPALERELPVNFAGSGTLAVDVTKTIQALRSLDLWDPKSLKVTFIRHDPVPTAPQEEDARFANAPAASVGRISLRSIPPDARR